MPIFIEYDKTTSKVIRIVSAGEPPEPVAHLGYQKIPDGMEIDLGSSLQDILRGIGQMMDGKPAAAPAAPAAAEESRFVEV